MQITEQAAEKPLMHLSSVNAVRLIGILHTGWPET